MRPYTSPTSSLLWIAGLVGIFFGERTWGGTNLGLSLAILGITLMAVATGIHLYRSKRSHTGAHKSAHNKAAMSALGGIGALALYALSSSDFLGDEQSEVARLALSCLWPIFLLISSATLVATDRLIAASPVVLQPRNVSAIRDTAAVGALALCLVFPANYLAINNEISIDLTYFQTTQAGSSTVGLVDSLENQVTVHIFQEPSSDVTDELLAFLRPLESNFLRVEVVDHAASPVLAESLRVPDNGWVALSIEPVEDAEDAEDAEDTDDDANESIVEMFEIGTELDSAKRSLRKLDETFHKALAEIALGTRVIYLTAGHQEMSLRGSTDRRRKLNLMKRAIQAHGYRLMTLEREDLLESVPEDAAAVLVLGANDPFVPAEIESLTNFQARGGPIMIALNPTVSEAGSPLFGLLDNLGLTQGAGVLASERNILPSPPYPRPRLQDRTNLITGSFSSHPLTTALSELSGDRSAGIAWPNSSFFTEKDEFEGSIAIAIRSSRETWSDVNRDFRFSLENGESKRQRSLAAAISGGTEETPWRAVVFSSAEAFSDFWTTFSGGTLLLATDAVAWLTGSEESSGEIESEEDIRIVHSSEDDFVWLYGTTLGVPVLVIIVGILRTKKRRTRT